MTIDDLLAHMGPELFVADLKATTKGKALEELTDGVVAGSKINDRHLILELLRNRERLGSTALQRGVAFPHGRSLAVSKLTVLAARSSAGIDFASEDGKPTHLFFVVLAPPQDSGNLYLQALGKIAGLLQNSAATDQFMAAPDWPTFARVLREAGR